MTPVESAIPMSGSLHVSFTPVTELFFFKEKSGGRRKTDCMVPGSEGREGDVFGILKSCEQ